MLMQFFVHVFGGVVERGCLKGLASGRDQVKNCVRGQLEARAYLLLSRRLKLDCFRLVPNLDHIGQSLQALRQKELLGRLKHQFLDKVDHLIDKANAHREISVNHHLLEALHGVLGDFIVEAEEKVRQ